MSAYDGWPGPWKDGPPDGGNFPPEPTPEPEVNIAERFLLKPEDVISIDEIVELREDEIDDTFDTYEEEYGTNPLDLLIMQEQYVMRDGSKSPFRSEEGLAREMLSRVCFSK